MVKRFAPTPESIKKEIRLYQRSEELILKRRPFERLVRELASEYQTGIHLSDEGLDTLQAVAEDFLVNILREAKRLSVFGGRNTVLERDVELGAARCAG